MSFQATCLQLTQQGKSIITNLKLSVIIVFSFLFLCAEHTSSTTASHFSNLFNDWQACAELLDPTFHLEKSRAVRVTQRFVRADTAGPVSDLLPRITERQSRFNSATDASASD